MDKSEQDVRRGQRAEAILADGLWIEAKAHIEAELFRLFKSVPPTDTEALQQIKGMQYMHDKYVAFMNKAVRDGKVAQAQIKEKEKASRLGRFTQRVRDVF